MLNDKKPQRFSQYFHQIPDEYILYKILKCFNMDTIVCNQIISKNHLCELTVIKKYNELIPDLSLYYSPRIINSFFYASPITFNKCITLLRHILSYFNHFIVRKEYIYKNKKTMHYTIQDASNYDENGKIPIRITRGKATLLTF